MIALSGLHYIIYFSTLSIYIILPDQQHLVRLEGGLCWSQWSECWEEFPGAKESPKLLWSRAAARFPSASRRCGSTPRCRRWRGACGGRACKNPWARACTTSWLSRESTRGRLVGLAQSSSKNIFLEFIAFFYFMISLRWKWKVGKS